MQNDLQKVLNLARKTGDRVVVFDYNKPENTYVVMPVEEYERMVLNNADTQGLTEGELLDKINRDIALWKSDKDFSVSENEKEVKQEAKTEAKKPAKGGSASGGKNWNIPKDIKAAAEEVMEEDKHYLEEVNF